MNSENILCFGSNFSGQAIAAKYHKVPFFAAVPVTTFDVTIPNGSFIHVELRPAKG